MMVSEEELKRVEAGSQTERVLLTGTWSLLGVYATKRLAFESEFSVHPWVVFVPATVSQAEDKPWAVLE